MLLARHAAPATALALAVIAGLGAPAVADGKAPVIDPTARSAPGLDPSEVSAEGTAQATGPGATPLFAPIPFRNSQLGWGLVLMGGLIHRFDSDTTIRPSTGAVAGFYTENQSWGFMALEMARLRRDTWRLRGLVSHAEINYDFYGIGEDAGEAGLSVALGQTMDFAVGSALYRLEPSVYGGASLLWIRTRIAQQEDHGLPIPPGPEDLATADLVAPGLQAEYDTRDDDYWPSRGSLGAAKASFFAPGLGSARDFQRYMAAWCWYSGLRGRFLVVATNVNAMSVSGDAPFWAVPSVGAGLYGLRGYTQGRYRDRLVTTAQAELRVHDQGRWGAAAFGGIAQVAPDVGGLGSARGLPAGGVGLRFQLAREYPMHMRADYAWGRNGGLLYFSVGEAF